MNEIFVLRLCAAIQLRLQSGHEALRSGSLYLAMY